MSNAFKIPASAFTPEERLRMAKQRAGSKGGTVKNERNDPKSGTYMPNAFTMKAQGFTDAERYRFNHSFHASRGGQIRAAVSPVKVTVDRLPLRKGARP